MRHASSTPQIVKEDYNVLDKDIKLADLQDSVNSFLQVCNPKDTDVIVTQCSDEEYGPLTTITVIYTPQPSKKVDNDDEQQQQQQQRQQQRGLFFFLF
jgi:hypothetical protein